MNLLYTLALTSVYLQLAGTVPLGGQRWQAGAFKKTGCNGGNQGYRDSTERSRSQKL